MRRVLHLERLGGFPSLLILQARLGSTRLPRKALLTLGSSTMMEAAMQRLERVATTARILACDYKSEEVFAPLARARSWLCCAGPEEDVLGRFKVAVEAALNEPVFAGIDAGALWLVRATADNPLVSSELATELLALRETADYLAHRGMTKGLGVEVFRASMLLRAAAEATKDFDREHVTPWLYDPGQGFRLNYLRPASFYRQGDIDSQVSLSIDTEADYQFVASLYDRDAQLPKMSDEELTKLLRQSLASRKGV